MPEETQAPAGFLEWFKGNALFVLTALGVLLYGAAAVPLTIFYNRLGTSPSEVGFTYASVLSTSTLFIGFFLLVTFVVGYALLFFFLITVALLAACSVLIFSASQLRPLGKGQELNAAQFDAQLTKLRNTSRIREPTWGMVERDLRRSRELGRQEYLTPEQVSEMKALSPQRIYMRVFLSRADSIAYSLRPRGPLVYWFLGYVVVVTAAVLTPIANLQANVVHDGTLPPFVRMGVFVYQAKPVTISSASEKTPKSITFLEKERMFLLGQNAQYVILYWPKLRKTIRIPVAAVVLTSRQEVP